jgi:type II secretory pathway component PulJ
MNKTSRRLSQFRRTRANVGFTLLEAVMAIGLTVLLMSSVYAFYDYCLKTREFSERRLARAELARMLLDQISYDLRSIIPQSHGYTPVLDGNREIVECVTASMPDRRLFADRKLRGPRIARETDLRRISWFLAYDEENVDENNEPMVVGIVRRTRKNMLAIQQFEDEERLDEEDRTYFDRLISQEVKYLEFSFFDGAKWLPTWEPPSDKAPQNQNRRPPIPVAIRTTIGFSPVSIEDLNLRRTESDEDPMRKNPDLYFGRYTAVIKLAGADTAMAAASKFRRKTEEQLGFSDIGALGF